jgi:hypothetical protein
MSLLERIVSIPSVKRAIALSGAPALMPRTNRSVGRSAISSSTEDAGRRSRGMTPVAKCSVVVTSLASRIAARESPSGVSLNQSAWKPAASILGATARMIERSIAPVSPMEN